MKDIICPYCEKPAELVTGETVYPHRTDLYWKKFYVCTPCDARVGCHIKTDKPLGRLANAELRAAKMKAHKLFDPMWRRGGMTRNEAYAWLSKRLEIDPYDCHIGMFGLELCKKVAEVCG